MSTRGVGSNQHGDKPPTRTEVLARVSAEAARTRDAARVRRLGSPRPSVPEPVLETENAERIVRAFADRGVRYVVVGGYAVRLYDPKEFSTRDIDLQAEKSEENIERLAEALTELRAVYRFEGDDREEVEVPFVPWTAEMVRRHTGGQGTITLRTRYGALDVGFGASGFPGGYDDFTPRATNRKLGSLDVPTASLDDVIASKTAAGRPKDLQSLRGLRRFAAEVRRKHPDRDESG